MLEICRAQFPEQLAVRTAVRVADRAVLGNHGRAYLVDVRTPGENSLRAAAHHDPDLGTRHDLLHRGQRRRHEQGIADVAQLDEEQTHEKQTASVPRAYQKRMPNRIKPLGLPSSFGSQEVR